MYGIVGVLGGQGKAILRYLLLNTDQTIVTNDLHGKAVPPDMEEMGKKLDPSGERLIHTSGMFLAGLEAGGFEEGVIISCLDPSRNADLASVCASRGWHHLDLGGDTSVARRILKFEKTALKTGSVLAPECGLAPGIVSSMAADGNLNGEPESIEQFCGGLPLYPDPCLPYVRSFSGKGLWREYTGFAEPRIAGLLTKQPALSGREPVFVPGFGLLEAFYTSGGQGMVSEFPGVPTYTYKTLRYHGHLDLVRNFVAHQPDPAAALEEMLPRVSADKPDVIILVQRITYRRKSVYRRNDTGIWKREERYFWRYDCENGISAMAQATGYPAAALATLIHDGKLDSGFLRMHEVPWPLWRDRICLMPNQFMDSAW